MNKERASKENRTDGAEPSQAWENEGEGNKSAARNYDDATEQYVKSGRVERAAEEAKRAVEGPEGDELRRAEEKGKAARRDN